MAKASAKDVRNSPTDSSTTCDWSEICSIFNSERDFRAHVGDRSFKCTPELEHIGVFRHGTATPTAVCRGASPETQGIFLSAPHVRNVTEPESFSGGFYWNGADCLLAREASADAHCNPVGIGVDRARRRHDVLFAVGVEDCLRRNAERGELW